MVEFEERFHGKEGAEVETRDNVSGVEKRFLGVDKQGNKWRARARNPLLRTRIHLGHYGTPEEAALAVNKKKAEFEEMFKGQESSSVGTRRGYFKGKKFYSKEGLEVQTRDGVSSVKKRFLGVDKQGNRWRARVRNPLLKADVHLGLYRTPEEAALVVKRKKAEFVEMLKGQESSNVGTCRAYVEGKKLPWGWGVRKRNGRNRVHIRHPKLKSWVSGGSYRACEDAAIVADKEREEFRDMYRGKVGKLIVMSGDAISSFNKKKAEFDANIALDDNSSCDIPGKLGDGLVHGSPTSVSDPKNISTVFVCDKTFDSEFDRAVSLGIINEYGQLLGEYSELDTQTWLSSTGKCYGFY